MSKQAVLNARKRRLALSKELEITMTLIRSSFVLLQRGRPYHPHPPHFAFMLLLTSGLERLMKILLMLHEYATTGQFLTEQQMKKRGHDLTKLRDDVITRCFTPIYLAHPHAQNDYDFLLHDPLFEEILSILTQFANRDRYLYLNAISDPDKLWNPPDRLWDQLESKAIGQQRLGELLVTNQLDVRKQEATKHLLSTLERGVRAFARLFILANLGDDAQGQINEVWEFFRLDDTALGTRLYEF